jgi:4-aminobutyrate aminotransferase-like enzyme
MFDADGRRYLDVYNNVASVGHCHPRVVQAIAEQAATLNTNTRYLYDNVHDYAERLLKTFPVRLSNIVFTCTGSESNDFALRLTKSFTGGAGFVVTETAYHGNTAVVTEVSPASFKTHSVAPHVRTVPAPDLYRHPTNDVGARFAEDIAGAIADIERNGVKFGGLLVDSIFSSDGIYADPPGFLKQAVDVVHQAGGLFISDEVQPGFGRTGTAMWGFQRHSVEPDIVTMGKPMGNGLPLGGAAGRADLVEAFRAQTHYFNTFGASPVHGAVGLAVLDELTDRDIPAHVRDVGGHLKTGLDEITRSCEQIGIVRARGLFLGIEWVEDRESRTPDPQGAVVICNALKDLGFLTSNAGAYENQVKIRPPLVFDRSQADSFLQAFAEVVAGVRVR